MNCGAVSVEAYCQWPPLNVKTTTLLFTFAVQKHIYQGWDSSAFTRNSVEQKLKSVVDDDHYLGKKINNNKIIPKQSDSESVLGLTAFCCVLKLFPDVHARCIVVLAFKNGHANIITRGLFIQGLLVFNA